MTALIHCTARTGSTESLDSCGKCSACIKLAAGSHPDVVLVEPDGRFIKIAQIREIHSKTRFQPFESERRVVVIDQAETIRDEAANALLKNLEEPRGDTMFMLVTANPQRLLTTIRSRCQMLRFGGLTPTDVAAILVSLGADEQQALIAGRLSQGSVGGAQHVLESPVYAERREIAARFAKLPKSTSGQILAFAEELGKGAASRDTLAIARTLYRDAALIAAGASEDRVVHLDMLDTVKGLAGLLGLSSLTAAVARIGEAEAMLNGNVNPRMAMETLLLTLADCPTRRLAPRLIG
ncbi:MAG: DNA polymerase-3 subunit delta' [Bradymonadia bacterium]|jgi:DNA polymerase-3 subunit delta'